MYRIMQTASWEDSVESSFPLKARYLTRQAAKEYLHQMVTDLTEKQWYVFGVLWEPATVSSEDLLTLHHPNHQQTVTFSIAEEGDIET